jgi:Flp pilus assembly protein TadB
MLSVIVAADAGAIGALVAVAIGLPLLGVVLAGVAAFLLSAVLLGNSGRRSVRRFDPMLDPRFPSPKT